MEYLGTSSNAIVTSQIFQASFTNNSPGETQIAFPKLN
jgi:hypothetical protein